MSGSAVHFLRDLGASPLGLAAVLLLSRVVQDAVTTALTGFLVFDAVHTVGHVVDLHHGGHGWYVAVLAAADVLLAAALRLGWRPRPRGVDVVARSVPLALRGRPPRGG